ncbi:MAG: NUDIX hydrolase [Clostridia bacterium]|nr:NUDIX hydrolase [Clostridia bacterium]
MSIGRSRLEEKTLSSERVFSGKIVSLRLDTVELPNGVSATREVVETRDSVAVAPITGDGSVVMVRQYRYAGKSELLEIPAGRMEAFEDPEVAAARELSEETGYECVSLTKIAGFYVAVGFATEYMHLFTAEVGRVQAAHPDEDEFVETELVPMSEIPGMIKSQKIKDVKTLAGLLYVVWTHGLASGDGQGASGI